MSPSSTDPPSTSGVDNADRSPLDPVGTPNAIESKPLTPDGRIDRWHRKLLDLTLRNRLLNFRVTKKTIPFHCPAPAILEDKLADGKRLKIVSLSDKSADSAATDDTTCVSQTDALETSANKLDEVAKQAFDRGEIGALISGEELTKRLTNLYRGSRNDLAEGGTNTLFLAVGFLTWKESPSAERSFRAPLILIPVKLLRRNAKSAYRLAHHEDDVRFNATLIEFLKRDFDCDLSEYETTLPRDTNGIDLDTLLENVRTKVAHLDGFEINCDSALATFSFAKYLMWKDLVDRSESLEQNRVVRHLVRNPEVAFEPTGELAIPRPEEMDRDFQPHQLIHPLDADSTQLAAVMAAARGHDFVLIGPPGTGKSQTIANMIAQCLSEGKTVLFVAEKTAALDVVQRRLHQNGLGDFCVELHSNKAERKRFLAQLDRAWRYGGSQESSNWDAINQDLKLSRNELASYVLSLHQIASNGWTPYRAMGVSVAGRGLQAPELHWANHEVHDQEEYRRMQTLAEQIALNFGAASHLPKMHSVQRTDWSMQWENDLATQCQKLEQTVHTFRPIAAELLKQVGFKDDDAPANLLDALNQLASELATTLSEDYRTVFDESLKDLFDSLARLDKSIGAFDAAAKTCSATFDDDQLRQIPVERLQAQWAVAMESFWPLSVIRKRTVHKLLQRFTKFGKVNPNEDFPRIRSMQRELQKIDNNPLSKRKHLWDHRHSAISSIRRHLERCQTIRDIVDNITKHLDAQSAGSLRTTLRSILQHGRPLAPSDAPSFAATDIPTESDQFLKAAGRFHDAFDTFQIERGKYERLAGGTIGPLESRRHLDSVVTETNLVLSNQTGLQTWTAWQKVRQEAERLGMEPLIADVESGSIALPDIPHRFELAYVRWWLPRVIDSNDSLRRFRRFEHEDTVRRFQDLDQQARSAASERVRQSIAHRLPSQDSVPRKSELGMLRHQIGLKRPSKSIRELVSMMPEHFSALAPCLLMSPLSIAQYLPAEQPPFDVVIFDEASQITTWDAIGAIARGKQTIIVGDPKQLPPTNFFGVTHDDEEDDSLEDHEKDLESILDETKASGLPVMQLNWHYRSRNESLIAFSNQHYYDNELVTFPSPNTVDSAVQLKHLPEAKYDRGKTRTNRIEAEMIVDDAVARMKQWLTIPETDRKTLGVVTFNSQQQTLIQDLFDQALHDNADLEWFFSDDRIEPTVVKNLENVQGDERDVMLFSITFGADESGKVPLTFGALNRDGGERRLNVAVTRAREELVVYSSFRADQLHAEKSKSRGVADLKYYLAYAERQTYESKHSAGEEIDHRQATLESAVAERLTEAGWKVARRVGVSGFRLPLAVHDPQDEHTFLAGIECDGTAYRDSATVRDRDKTRELVLANLGWHLLRVWSRDWWYDPDGAFTRLDDELCELLKSRKRNQNNRS